MTIYARLVGFNGEEIDVIGMPYETTLPLWLERPVLTAPLHVHMGYPCEDDDLPALPMGIGESPLSFHTERYVHIGDGNYRRIR